ncbi:ImuA family protein [Salaquimonas pukyongi]|uniref:ImuA family protein n=1 Tax=Salaquimonas pukyongi TaxID=2712698 RepID=UPI0012ECB7A6|nr:hypothetical protein [Salaquimonas pukyongi]
MPSLSMLKQMAGQDGHLPDANAAQEKSRLSLGVPAIDGCLSGGLARHGLHEVRCAHGRDIGAATGFALSLLARAGKAGGSVAGRVLWIIDPAAAVDGGLPFADGLRQHGIDAGRLVLVRPSRLKDAVWSAGEAARCGELAAVIVQIRGNPAAFDATASRRLLLRARENGVFTMVLRQSGGEEASAALTRWHARACPSLPDEGLYGEQTPWGIGRMRLALTLEKNRNGQTGQWHVSWNPRTGAFEHAAQNPQTAHPGNPLSVSCHRPDRPPEMGQVLALGRAS